MRKLTFRDVSSHRAVLYGFAALWIAFFHMDYAVPAKGALYPLAAFQKFGACGVELFVLLSGIGLYRSMQKDSRIGVFYKKRLMRVLIPSLIVSTIVYGTIVAGVVKWIAAALFIPFWFGYDTLWYVPFILTMYLLYPAIYALQRKAPKALWGLMAVAIAGALVGAAVDSITGSRWTGVCLRGIARMPVFLLGCMIAPRFDRGGEIPRWVLPVSLLAALGACIAWRVVPVATYFFRTAFYTFLSVFLILLITRLCILFCHGGIAGFLYRFFAFCGGCSLEIYLLYGRVCLLMHNLPTYKSGRIDLLQMELLSLFITVILSSLLVKLSGHLIREFSSVALPERETEK